MFNALQLPASELNDWVVTQLDMLRLIGCSGVLMTGSGSTCFGLIGDGTRLAEFEEQIQVVGIPRSYRVSAWYGNSIEQQLEAAESHPRLI
jgi:4-diphosphocytidyl-2C-methyl-D-erythritol kinase